MRAQVARIVAEAVTESIGCRPNSLRPWPSDYAYADRILALIDAAAQPAAWLATSDEVAQLRLFAMRTEAEAWLAGTGGGKLVPLYPGPMPSSIGAALAPAAVQP